MPRQSVRAGRCRSESIPLAAARRKAFLRDVPRQIKQRGLRPRVGAAPVAAGSEKNARRGGAGRTRFRGSRYSYVLCVVLHDHTVPRVPQAYATRRDESHRYVFNSGKFSRPGEISAPPNAREIDISACFEKISRIVGKPNRENLPAPDPGAKNFCRRIRRLNRKTRISAGRRISRPRYPRVPHSDPGGRRRNCPCLSW